MAPYEELQVPTVPTLAACTPTTQPIQPTSDHQGSGRTLQLDTPPNPGSLADFYKYSILYLET